MPKVDKSGSLGIERGINISFSLGSVVINDEYIKLSGSAFVVDEVSYGSSDTTGGIYYVHVDASSENREEIEIGEQ
jgi:hypothetical protein